MQQITVFTPTYNRADCLHKCYESLKEQSDKRFCWLIIDDGSTDGTADLVKKWSQQEKSFEIRYFYKENGGLHTAYNEAIAHLDTELAMCIDSDDYLAENAIARILRFWEEHGNDRVAGIVGLDADEQGKVYGDKLPEQRCINLIDLLTGKYRIRNGDRKLVVRSTLYRSVAPQRTFPGEKNFNPHYMHLQISQHFDFLVMNEVLCIVEYQPDGMTKNIFRQYYSSPKSFAETRRLYLTFKNAGIVFRFKHCIHYVANSITAKDKCLIQTSPAKLLTVFAFLPGIALALYIRYRATR